MDKILLHYQDDDLRDSLLPAEKIGVYANRLLNEEKFWLDELNKEYISFIWLSYQCLTATEEKRLKPYVKKLFKEYDVDTIYILDSFYTRDWKINNL